MATITFDTLKFVDRLTAAGVPEQQAKAEASALRDVLSDTVEGQLATKGDITRLERRMDGLEGQMREMRAEINGEFKRMDGELKLNRWMTGVMLAGVLSLVLKAFFGH